MAFAGCRLKSTLIGHHEVAQALNHVLEDIGGNDAVLQQCLLPLCPRRGHLFASSHWHADRGCWLEAIDTPRGYVMQQGLEERHTVSIRRKIQYRWMLRQNSGEALPLPSGPIPALK